MKKIASLGGLLLLASLVIAQTVGPPGSTSSSAPCSAFGTTAGTCAQGNDSRFTPATSTVTTPGITVSGCASWTPTDQSGASLPLTSVTGEYCVSGPAGGQMVTVFYSVTYPITADGSSAKLSLPIPVPNQAYAVVKGTSGISSTSVNTTARTNIATNPGTMSFTPAATNVATTNAALTASTLTGSIQYPMQ